MSSKGSDGSISGGAGQCCGVEGRSVAAKQGGGKKLREKLGKKLLQWDILSSFIRVSSQSEVSFDFVKTILR